MAEAFVLEPMMGVGVAVRQAVVLAVLVDILAMAEMKVLMVLAAVEAAVVAGMVNRKPVAEVVV
jgi:hypothetical protein